MHDDRLLGYWWSLAEADSRDQLEVLVSQLHIRCRELVSAAGPDWRKVLVHLSRGLEESPLLKRAEHRDVKLTAIAAIDAALARCPR